MRLNRNTLLTVGGLFVFIVLALVFLNTPTLAPDETPTPETEMVRVFPRLDLDNIQRLLVTDSAGNALAIVQQSDGNWAVENNPNPATQVALDTAISGIINMQSAQSFPVDNNLATYGLDAPRYTIVVNDGTTTATLRIGNQNPAGTRTYALVDDDDTTVYLLSSPTAISTVTAYLTNAPVLVITPTSVPQLVQAGPLFPEYDPQRTVKVTLLNNSTQENLTLLKQADGTWALDPFSTNYSAQPLDQMLASTLGTVFGGFRALDVLTDVSDTAALGLAAPTYTLTATRDDNYAYSVQVGGSDASGTRRYVQILDLPNVAVVKAEELGSLIQFIGAPPYMLAVSPEATPEATVEATAEVTSAP